jgi:hypothetical protein
LFDEAPHVAEQRGELPPFCDGLGVFWANGDKLQVIAAGGNVPLPQKSTAGLFLATSWRPPLASRDDSTDKFPV